MFGIYKNGALTKVTRSGGTVDGCVVKPFTSTPSCYVVEDEVGNLHVYGSHVLTSAEISIIEESKI